MQRLAVHALCLALVIGWSFNAVAQERPRQTDKPTERKSTQTDGRFLTQALQDNLAEVQLGKLAAERGTSDDVKKFGDRMASDHQKAFEEAQKMAQQKGVPVPKEPGRQAKREYDRLSKLSGQEFDRAYMKAMVREHDKDVKAFEREAKNGKDTDAKDWAAKTLPTLQEHQKLARDVAAKVGSGGAKK